MWARLLLLAPITGAVLVRSRRRRTPGSGEAPAASWARRRDLRALRVPGRVCGRLTLGRSGGLLVAAEARQSVIAMGPSQSGKTTGLAVPAILEWDGPLIATSVKEDLLRDTITARCAAGEVWVYDPTGTSGHRGPLATWSPLAACDTWQGAQRTAAWLVESGRSDGGLQEADFWHATAAKLLGPLLFAAATSQRTMADVVRWVDTQEEREVRFELEVAAVPEAIHAAEASWAREERQKSYRHLETLFDAAVTHAEASADPLARVHLCARMR